MQIFGYIYITTNNITGQKYIGQRFSKQIHKYKNLEDDPYLGSGTILRRAISKYGKSNFTKQIVQICYSADELNEAEKYWINHYKANINLNMDFYNVAAGGCAGDNWTGQSVEQKEHFREIIRNSNKNRIRDTSCIKGVNNPAYGKKWCNDGKANYLLSIEEINKLNLKLGMIRTPEHNQKISLAHKGKKHNYSTTKDRICYNNGINNKFIDVNDISYYEDKGWIKGMIRRRKSM